MPDLTPHMERELAELEAALAPIVRDARHEPRPEYVQRLDRRVRTGSWQEPRPARARRRWQPLLSLPALGTVAAAVLVVVLVVSYEGGSRDEMASTGATRGGASAEVAGGGSGGATAAEDSAAQSADGG